MQIDELVLITNKDGIIEYVNPAFEKFTGYTRKEAVGKKSNLLKSGKQSDKQYKKLWNTILDGTTYTAEITNKKKNNNLYYEAKTITPIKNKDGEITHFVSVGRDITNRKETELKFDNSWGQFKSLIENISDIILLFTSDGIIKYSSPSIETSLGYMPKEVINKKITNYIHKSDVEKFLKIIDINNLKTKKIVKQDIKICHKNGSCRYFEAVVKEIINDRIIINARDITEKINTENSLRDSRDNLEEIVVDKTSELKEILKKLEQEIEWRKELENQMLFNTERLELVLDITKQGVIDFDFISNKGYYNDKFYEILGYNKKDLKYFSFEDWFKIIHPDDLMYFKKELLKHIKSEIQVFKVENRILTKNNETKWILCRGKIIQRDENDEPIRFIGKIEDIDLRKKAEEEIKRAFAIEKELNNIKSSFISMVSHEFRTPLAVILSSSEILELYSNQLSEMEKMQQFEKIKKTINGLRELLNDVIEINKADLGKTELHFEDIELNEYCKNIIKELSFEPDDIPNIHFSSNVENFMFNTDVKQLKHILQNLINNAIKYTPKEKNIYVEIKVTENKVTFKISDEGAGIEEKDKNKIFEPFYRGNNVGKINGSGLGLSVLKRSVKLLQGDVNFKSNIEKGTTFEVIIPVIYEKNN